MKYVRNLEKYWVYTIYVPSINKYYVGCSSYDRTCKRFQKSKYKSKSVGKYLDEYDTWQFNVVVDSMDKEEALQLEEKIIQFYKKNDKLINKYQSGHITKDIKKYKHDWYLNNKNNK